MVELSYFPMRFFNSIYIGLMVCSCADKVNFQINKNYNYVGINYLFVILHTDNNNI
jgi:hypothetical protein